MKNCPMSDNILRIDPRYVQFVEDELEATAAIGHEGEITIDENPTSRTRCNEETRLERD